MSDERSSFRRIFETGWRWIGFVLTAIALALDALLTPVLDPVQDWLSRQAIVRRIERFVAAKKPYTVLALVAGPVVVRQAIKLVAFVVIATEDPFVGSLLYIASRIANILLVSRIYEAGRDKLLTIDWFRRAHDWIDRRSEQRLEAFRQTRTYGWMERWLGVGG